MAHKHTVAPSRWILVVLTALACPAASVATSSPLEQALGAIGDCMAASPPAWPQGWQSEYVNAIRDALRGHEAPADYTLKLNALAEGFPLYWQDVTTNGDRALFELQRAEIQWYVQHLVTSNLPSEGDSSTIREQVEDLWQDAADSLMAQFTFLDPNTVSKARADHLHECLRWVDAPLKPIFRQPFATEQINRIREGWHELRYARVDLMRQLGGEDVFLALRPREAAPSDHPHYLLTYRSLEQLESFIWTVVTRPPEDYLKAQQNYWKARQRQRQRALLARAQEQRLATERSRHLPQTEYLSFLLAVVLEAAQQLGIPPAEGPSHGFCERVDEAPPKEVMPMR